VNKLFHKQQTPNALSLSQYNQAATFFSTKITVVSSRSSMLVTTILIDISICSGRRGVGGESYSVPFRRSFPKRGLVDRSIGLVSRSIVRRRLCSFLTAILWIHCVFVPIYSLVNSQTRLVISAVCGCPFSCMSVLWRAFNVKWSPLRFLWKLEPHSSSPVVETLGIPVNSVKC
jgi:hypothetical protein